jgi:[glutamine synthetase] adenylyltransferase / [glutamine synthetase]-adenylyl-L-tyrosine phosphorylase
MPFGDIVQHFSSGVAPVWQCQALCQARAVFGDSAAAEQVARMIRELIVRRRWNDSDLAEVRRSRLQMEQGASPRNLKRGPGGTLDVEYIVQMLELRLAATRPEVLITNTQSALASLGTAGAIAPAVAERLGDSYRFLRRVESGLRLMETTARHDLPMDSGELRQLALLLGHSNPDRLAERCLQHMAENRAEFDRLTG